MNSSRFPSSDFVNGEAAGWFEPVPGEHMRIRVDSRVAGERFSVFESIAAPGSGPPIHCHPQDELIHVLEGSIIIQRGAERLEAGPGTIVAIPAGMPHGWFNFGSAPAHLIAIFSPGGTEELLTGIGQVAAADMSAFAASYGAEVLGPPLGPSPAGPRAAESSKPSRAATALFVTAAWICALLNVMVVQLAAAAPGRQGGMPNQMLASGQLTISPAARTASVTRSDEVEVIAAT